MAKQVKKKRASVKNAAVPPVPARIGGESMLAELTRLMRGQEFAGLEDAQAFMNRLLEEGGGRIPAAPPQSLAEQAQALVYDAWEAPTDRKATALARQALALDPDCADAYNVLAETDAKSVEMACDFYQLAAYAGHRSLGEAFFTEHRGHFWAMIETRPYMRARQGWADCLWAMGRARDSIAHNEALLDLNPNDNQGIRDVLLSQYLVLGDDAAAERLFRQYPHDSSAAFLWSRVLLNVRCGDQAASEAALLAAMEYNPHVAGFFSGKKKVPAVLPDAYSPGSREEAVLYIADFGEAWMVSPDAMDWVIGRVGN